MIEIIIYILLAITGLFIFYIAALLPIAKLIYTYGESKDDWYSHYEEEALD
jgi:hypothetical protein